MTPRANRASGQGRDGSIDTAFAANVGTGPDSAIYALALLPGGDIVLGGAFIDWNGTPRARIARIKADGTLAKLSEKYFGADVTK